MQEKAYHLAISYSRLQEYDKAIVYFQKAIDEKSAKQDVYYEYGQALYAANEIKKARSAFKISAQNNFNQATSLYYVGHTSQILEEYEAAITIYKLIISHYSSEIKITQVAQFQLAEATLSNMKDKTAANVSKYVLPLMKTAQAKDQESALAKDIDRRYKELLIEYNLDPDLLSNGRRISSRHWEASFGQKIKFDTNVTLANFENNKTQTQKTSFIYDTEVYYQQTYVLQKMFLIAPELRLNFTQYSDRKNSDVFQNDSYIISFALKNKFEHSMFKKPASMILDIDYSKTSKDFNKKHSRDPYSSSLGFSIGERVTLFDAGDSTLKYTRKDFQGTDTSINNYTNEFSLDQTLALSNQNLLILMVDFSKVDNYNNSFMNTDSVLFRVDYLMPEIFWKQTLTVAMATTFTDTKQQQLTRGSETTLNPSLNLSRNLTKAATISLNYDFTKNSSKSSDYTYNKHVTQMEFKYVF
jgi:tetratricopeptide (TPR) repeat protein